MNAASCSLNKSALSSLQNTILAPACISFSARANKSSLVAVDQMRNAFRSSLLALPYHMRPMIAEPGGVPTSLRDIEATRTVCEDGEFNASRAPPNRITVAIVRMNTLAPARTPLESSPASQIQLQTAANQPIRKVMPHIPVTERTWSKRSEERRVGK